MSGKIIQDKESIKQFGHQDRSVKSASNPPPLPSRGGSLPRPIPTTPVSKAPKDSPISDLACSKCGDTKGVCIHQYEEIAGLSQDLHRYEPLLTNTEINGSDLDSRLRKIEDNQMRLRNEFNDFRNIVSKEIRSLDSSIKRLMEMSDGLDESMRDSFVYVHSLMEKMHKQLLENNDHLGKQIFDVKKNIVELAKQQPPSLRSPDTKSMKKCVHTFEWEAGNLDSMVKHQQSASSQSYLIGEVDFKILGSAVCTRDGRLSVKIYGEHTHVPKNFWDLKNGEFECAAFIVDKTERQSDWLVGSIQGDFNNEKEWVIGDVPVCDVKVKGFSALEGSVHVKFVIEVFD